jgi:hypothetical protein
MNLPERGHPVKLSQSQQKALKDELLPLLRPYFQHQGWPDLATADTATEILLGVFGDLGVRL